MSKNQNGIFVFFKPKLKPTFFLLNCHPAGSPMKKTTTTTSAATSTSARRVGRVRATPSARTSRGLSSALARMDSGSCKAAEMETLAKTLTSAWRTTAVSSEHSLFSVELLSW